MAGRHSNGRASSARPGNAVRPVCGFTAGLRKPTFVLPVKMIVASLTASSSSRHPRGFRRLLAIAFVCAGAITLRAEIIRVTTWNLATTSDANATVHSADAEESLINKAAETLDATDSDIIVLREVSDRQLCKRVAERLKSGPFGVIICSDFEADPNVAAAPLQVAILSRKPAFAAWTENWKPEGAMNPAGGFAFAGIQFGEADVCIYALQLNDTAPDGKVERESRRNVSNDGPFLRQLVRHATTVDNRATNRSRAFVITGRVYANSAEGLPDRRDALRVLEESGFRSAFEDRSFSNHSGQTISDAWPDSTSDIVLFRNGALIGQPGIASSGAADRPPATYDLLVAPSAMALAVESRSSGGGGYFERARRLLLWLGLAAGVIVVVFLFGRRAFGKSGILRQSERLPSHANFSTALSRTTYVNRLATDASSGGQVTQAPTETASSDVPLWRQRALEAERRAEQAKAVAKDRLMPHLARMMKDKLLWRLLAQRSQTIRIHDASAKVVAELEQRLAVIQSHFESRVQSYENRIAELERDLAAKDSINHELLESRIQVARIAVEQAAPAIPKPSVVYTLRFGDLMARKTTVKTQTRQESDVF